MSATVSTEVTLPSGLQPCLYANCVHVHDHSARARSHVSGEVTRDGVTTASRMHLCHTCDFTLYENAGEIEVVLRDGEHVTLVKPTHV